MRGVRPSVVMATFNRGHTVAQAIKSVLAQDHRDFEFLVVDDGSTDDTSRVLGRFIDPRLRVIRQKNRERGAARNIGVELSLGTHIAFIDSDDLWDPRHLSSLVRAASDNHDAGLIFSRARLLDNVSREVFQLLPDRSVSKVTYPDLLKGNRVALSASMVSRTEFNLVGGFEEDRVLQNGAEDWELWLRIAARTPIVYIPTTTATIVFHSENTSADARRYLEALRAGLSLVLRHPQLVRGSHRTLARSGFTRAIVRTHTTAGDRRAALIELCRAVAADHRLLARPHAWGSLLLALTLPRARSRTAG